MLATEAVTATSGATLCQGLGPSLCPPLTQLTAMPADGRLRHPICAAHTARPSRPRGLPRALRVRGGLGQELCPRPPRPEVRVGIPFSAPRIKTLFFTFSKIHSAASNAPRPAPRHPQDAGVCCHTLFLNVLRPCLFLLFPQHGGPPRAPRRAHSLSKAKLGPRPPQASPAAGPVRTRLSL